MRAAPGHRALEVVADHTGRRDQRHHDPPRNDSGLRRQASAIEDLKTIAISRLVFDNVPHVKGYWIMLGQDTAAAALHFGASDLDGTIGQEKIAHAALAKSPVGMAEAGMVQMIREAGKIPVQRDALYRVIREYPRRDSPPVPAAIPPSSSPQPATSRSSPPTTCSA